MTTEKDWIEAFFSEGDAFNEAVECDLSYSMQGGSTDIGVVLRLLGHPDNRLRACVAWALNELSGETHSAFLPAIYTGLDDPYHDVRYWCLLALRHRSDSHNTETMLRVFLLLRDEAFWVRDKAAEVVHRLERPMFEGALKADPITLGFSATKAAAISVIQEELQQGYRESQSLADICGNIGESLQGLTQLGYGIGVGYWWSAIARSMDFFLHALSPDVRHHMAERVGELTKAGIDAARSLSVDPEPRFRLQSWHTLGRLVREIQAWLERISISANDVEQKIRGACFRSLPHQMPREVISSIISACRKSSDHDTQDEALEALENMVRTARKVTAIDNDTLQYFVQTLDDLALSSLKKTRSLNVLQDLAQIFVSLRDQNNINWSQILSRTIPDC